MKYTLSESVHVEIVLDGVSESFDFDAGSIELPEAVASLLVAQGFATEGVTSKKSKPADPAPADSIETTQGA